MVTKRNRTRRAFSLDSPSGKGLVAAGVLLGGVLLFSFFFDEMGVTKYMAMWNRSHFLQQEISLLQQSNVGLRKEIFRLKHDPARLEELAREQLGLVRQGETVYQLVQPPRLAPTQP